MRRDECMELVRSKIMKQEKLSWEDSSAIKAVVLETERYLDNNITIPKETAKGIIAFVDFMKRTTIHARTYADFVYKAFVKYKPYDGNEYSQEEIRELDAWIAAYNDTFLQKMLLGQYDLAMLRLLKKLNRKTEFVYKPAMNAVIRDYVYANEMQMTLSQTGTYQIKSRDYPKLLNKKRYELYKEKKVLNAGYRIKEYYLWNKEYDRGMIEERLKRMQGVMQNTTPGTVDTMDFLQLLYIYGIGTSEMFRFNYYEENIQSLDFFVTQTKGVIDNA